MGVFKRKGSKNQNGGESFDVWWYEFNFRGTRIRESARTRSKEIAERIMRERRRKVELGAAGVREVAKPITFSLASKNWLDTKQAQWSKSNLRIETFNVGHLLPHFGKMLLSDIDADDIARYQAARKNEEASPKTINLEVASLRAILRRHRLWANIQPDVKMLKVSEEIGRALSADEQHRLLVACRKSRSRGLYTAFLVSLHTGLRSGELLNLRWSNIDLIAREVTVGKSKTLAGEGRKVPLSNAASQALQDWRKQFREAKPAHYVFPSEKYGLDGEKGHKNGKIVPYAVDPTKPISSFKVAWDRARKIAKVNCRWHDARHTFISKLGEGAASDRTIMELAGHVSKKMLQRYSHIGNTAKRQAIAVFDKVETQKPKQKQAEQKRYPHFHPHSERVSGTQIM